MTNRGKLLFFMLSGLVLLATANPALAQFPWAGARATGMGGAQVAAVNDATAAWSNPAALGRLEGWSIQVFGNGLASNRNNLLGTIDELAGLPFDEIADGSRLDLLPVLVEDLVDLTQEDTSVLFSGTAGIVAAYRGFALSVGDVPYAGIYPVIDLVNIDPRGGVHGIQNNGSGLYLNGLEAREIRLAYGRGLMGNTVLVGGAARLVFGRTYLTRCGVFDCAGKDLSDLVREAFKENSVDTTKFALDLGAMANLGIFKLGIVGASLNEPRFDVIDLPGSPQTVELPRQVRAGVSVDALPVLTLAADGDLIRSDTLAPGVKSQQLSLGAEVHLPVFAFRVGAFRDFAASRAHWSYAAGVGFGFAVVSVDASIVLSPKGGVDPTDLDREDLGAALGARVHF